jgi:hypothetical protein
MHVFLVRRIKRAHFVFEVKKQDGEEYTANCLHGLVCAIQRYLKTQCGKNVDFFNDVV